MYNLLTLLGVIIGIAGIIWMICYVIKTKNNKSYKNPRIDCMIKCMEDPRYNDIICRNKCMI